MILSDKRILEEIDKGNIIIEPFNREKLGTMLHTDEYIDCQVDEHGKPYLVNLPYHISLSHSFDYAAVMISKSKPVGIDIELISQKVERIAHKFLNQAELALIEPEHKIEQLYVCWCAKEAVYKCNGRKVISFLDHIRLEPHQWATTGNLQAIIEKGEIFLEFDVNYIPFGDYMIGYVKAK